MTLKELPIGRESPEHAPLNLLQAKWEALGASVATTTPEPGRQTSVALARLRHSGSITRESRFALNMPALSSQAPLAIARWRHNGGEVLVEGGQAVPIVMSLTENRAERLSRGRTSFARPRVGSVSVPDPEEVTRFNLQGHTDVFQLMVPLREIASAAGPDQSYKVSARFFESEPELERCMTRALVALHEQELPDRLLLSSIALQLSLRLIEQPRASGCRAAGGLASRQLRRVKELISARASEPLATSPTLVELATEADLTLSHFARAFHCTVGLTPYAYMLRRRIEQAKVLVACSDVPLMEVARRSGFQSPVRFAERFRREVGVAPDAVRRAVKL